MWKSIYAVRWSSAYVKDEEAEWPRNNQAFIIGLS